MQFQISKIEYIAVNKAARKRIAKAEAEQLCVACMQPLDGTRVIRGCHERCYRATLRLIHKGKTTEVERMQAGKLLESDEAGRKPSNPVTAEFE